MDHYSKFISALLSWYSKHKRDLPWRRTRDPYCIWISEIMLQQTQVVTVIDYYHRFLAKFPTIESLAQAPLEDVLAQWSGLGYYSRARNLQRAAQHIVEKHQGKFPEDPQEILALPGIGRYTLGAIASIAFEQALPLVDGNVIRVYSRLMAWKGSPSETVFQKKIWALAEEIIQSIASPSPQSSPRRERRNQKSYGDFNQALMELGATVCTPQNPACLICPLQSHCEGRSLGPENYPEKKKTAKVQKLHRHAAVVRFNNEVLLCISSKHRWMKHLWQLPSLWVQNSQDSNSLFEHLRSLGIHSKNVKTLQNIQHQVTHHKIQIQPFLLEASKHKPPNQEGEKYEWHSLTQLKELGIPAADRKILAALL